MISDTLLGVILGGFFVVIGTIINLIYQYIKDCKKEKERIKETANKLFCEIEIISQDIPDMISGIRQIINDIKKENRLIGISEYPIEIKFYESLVGEVGKLPSNILIPIKKFYNNILKAKKLLDEERKNSYKYKKEYANKGHQKEVINFLAKNLTDYLETAIVFMDLAKKESDKAKKALQTIISE